jgi:hypothetical protein
MLRRTNRLKELLASHGLELWLVNGVDEDGDDIPPSDIVEAECPQELQSQLTSIFGLLELLGDNHRDYAHAFGAFERSNHPPVLFPAPPDPDWEDNISILWLSETVFVTRMETENSAIEKHVNHLFKMEVEQQDDRDFLSTYNLVNDGLACPETQLAFLAHLAQPHLPLPCIEFGTAFPAAVALSLVPTTAPNVGNQTRAFLEKPSPAILEALALHPVHHDIIVSILLSSRTPIFFLIEKGAPCPTLQYNPSCQVYSLQESFERFCGSSETLSQYNPAFACYQVMFPSGLRSNRQWDSLVVPTLVLKWLHRQQGGLPPDHLLGLAMKSINEGISYHCAANLVPFNSDAANATAIFALLQHGPYGTSPDE